MFVGEDPIHIKTESRDDIAPLVIMPGDPLRAKYIAEHFLEDAKLVTSVRNMLGYTGYYKGVRVTTMGSGMGMPSMSIYAFELFHYYNVQKIIRVGTCGVVTPDINIPEVLLAEYSWTESNFALSYINQFLDKVYPSKELNENIKKVADMQNLKLHVGPIYTSDVFGPYVDMQKVLDRAPQDIKFIGEEMESYALFLTAKEMKRNAACILTAVDSKYSDVVLTPAERETSLNTMLKLALDSIIL